MPVDAVNKTNWEDDSCIPASSSSKSSDQERKTWMSSWNPEQSTPWRVHRHSSVERSRRGSGLIVRKFGNGIWIADRCDASKGRELQKFCWRHDCCHSNSVFWPRHEEVYCRHQLLDILVYTVLSERLYVWKAILHQWALLAILSKIFSRPTTCR